MLLLYLLVCLCFQTADFTDVQLIANSVVGFVSENASLCSNVFNSSELEFPLLFTVSGSPSSTQVSASEEYNFRVVFSENIPFTFEGNELVTEQALDYETNREYTFEVIATSTTDETKIFSSLFTVKVLNTYESSVIFSASKYYVTTTDYACEKINPVLIGVKATIDNDGRYITYQLENTQPKINMFSVFETRFIICSGRISPGEYVLPVKASVVKHSYLFAFAEVHVTIVPTVVLDVPSFYMMKTYYLIFPTKVYIGYIGEHYNQVRYFLDVESPDNGVFAINVTTGDIYINKPLNKDPLMLKYEVRVKAIDGGKLFKESEQVSLLHVHIDRNQHTPEFTRKHLNVLIYLDHDPNTPLFTPTFFDNDTIAPYNELIVDIIKENQESDLFEMRDRTQGAIFLKQSTKVNFLVNKDIEIKLQVQDGGYFPRSSEATVLFSFKHFLGLQIEKQISLPNVENGEKVFKKCFARYRSQRLNNLGEIMETEMRENVDWCGN